MKSILDGSGPAFHPSCDVDWANYFRLAVIVSTFSPYFTFILNRPIDIHILQLLFQARIVLIDEATASVDPAVEAALTRALRSAFVPSPSAAAHLREAPATILMVCHRVEGIRSLCNKVSLNSLKHVQCV